MFKVNNRNRGTMCGICLKLTTKTPERRLWRRSCVFIFNFEHISHLALLILLLTLSMLMPDGLPFLLEITTLRFTCSKKNDKISNVNNSHTLAEKHFIFLKNVSEQTLKSFNMKFRTQWKVRKSSYRARQFSALLRNLAILIWGKNCIKGLDLKNCQII